MSALPCLLCGKELEQRADKHSKPYFVCDPCGMQLFVRRKEGIEHLSRLVDTVRDRQLVLSQHSHTLFEIRAILEELDGVGQELKKLDDSADIFRKTPKETAQAKKLLRKRMRALIDDLQRIVK